LAEQRAEILFNEFRAAFGEERARCIFEAWGKPSAARLKEIRNLATLDRLDLMGPHGGGPNVKRLAQIIAHEKYKNPTLQQIQAEERQIFRLTAKRKLKPRRG
jgi:hypothetical protein